MSAVSGAPAVDAPSVTVQVFVPSAWGLLVTVSPLGSVIASYVGTPLIFTDIVSSESTGVAVIPSDTDPPAVTSNDVLAIVSAGVSAGSIVILATAVCHQPLATYSFQIVLADLVEEVLECRALGDQVKSGLAQSAVALRQPRHIGKGSSANLRKRNRRRDSTPVLHDRLEQG